MTNNWLLQESKLSLEVVILLIGGLTMLILGILLFPIYAGILPYYAGGLHGLLLFIFALQTITLGKTPFGDVPRSWFLIFIGIVIATIGIVTCFIPGFMGSVPRILLIICFGIGGIFLLFQLFLSKNRFQAWRKYGGIYHHLTIACVLVYSVSVSVAVLLYQPEFVATWQTAAVTLIFGLVILYLSWVLQKISGTYRNPGECANTKTTSLLATTDVSFNHIMLIVVGWLILILGMLLIPVNLGLLPFSGSAQLGLIMVIFAIQMIAIGNTPIGPFSRSRLMVMLGLIFASLGIASCIIPEILVTLLTILIGFLNLVGGIAAIVKIIMSAFKAPQSAEPAPKIQVLITMAVLTMNILTIIFGLAMLLPSIIPGLVLGVILAADGGMMLFLVYLLLNAQRMLKAVASYRTPYPD